MSRNSLSRALGMLERKGQRPLSLKAMEAALSGGAWERVYERAVQVFGSEDEAIKWMWEEAFGLPDRQRPVDLLGSPDGTEMIMTYLDQIEYCVFI